MVGSSVFDTVLIGVIVFAVITFFGTLVMNADYGKLGGDFKGPSVPVRLGWVLMEAPASLVFLYFFVTGPNATTVPALVLLFMWQLHYVHRSFIYPFQLSVRENARTALYVTLSGMCFCAANGYLNGAYISHYAPHLTNEWLSDPRFYIGIVIFAYGYYLNKQSDRILRELRQSPGEGYKIPYGGGFKWVSMPNYLGEMITWTGFAIAGWSIAGWAFVLMTAANLVPRALASHRWYKENFADYPPERKAVIPYII